MWGIIPAAGRGSRIQPLAFSKELLPVGSRVDPRGERPVAVSEYLIARLLSAGVDKLCFVISPGKSDILEYFGGRVEAPEGAPVAAADVTYVVQERPAGLCDALFRAAPFIHNDEWVCVGLPDTIWFPETGLAALGDAPLSFLLFPVDTPALFDAVSTDEHGRVEQIEVKTSAPKSHWVWGAFKLRGGVLKQLQALWNERGQTDEYFGTLVNAYLERGGSAQGVRAGRAYVDVGTFNGYREAVRLLEAVKLVSSIQGVAVGAGPTVIDAAPALVEEHRRVS